MKRFLKLLVTGTCLAILMNCSPTTQGYHQEELKPYINEFVRIGKLFKIPSIETKTNQLDIILDKLQVNIGVCYPFLHSVILDKEEWVRIPPENREELIFHELGHCVLGYMEHSVNGIMREKNFFSPVFYKNNYKLLINDLFGCKSGDCVDISYDENKYKSLNKEKYVTKEEILANKHAVIRFTAQWCPPCKALAPVFSEVAQENPNVVTYIIDIDEGNGGDLASTFGVRGIPTMVVIKDGKAVDKLVGNQPKPEIEKLFK